MLVGTPGATYMVDFLAAGEIAQQGGLHVVGVASVLNVGDGLQLAHAFCIEADRDGDLGPLGGSRSTALGGSAA